MIISSATANSQYFQANETTKQCKNCKKILPKLITPCHQVCFLGLFNQISIPNGCKITTNYILCLLDQYLVNMHKQAY